MDREVLKQVIADQKEYRAPKLLFDRTQVREIQRFIDDPSIIIISGIRRSGKSTIQRILQHESDYYFNFDDDRLIHFTVEDFQTLLEVMIELYGKQKTFYFDEIQNIAGWERFVRRLYEQGYKIFITGSNAKLLSRELGTHLTGRYIQFEIYPLSFREVLKCMDKTLSEKKVFTSEDTGMLLQYFANYLRHGGIPDYFKFRKPEYLKSLYEGILYKDIMARYKLTNEKALRELVYYFASNIGKEFSLTKIGAAIGISSPNTTSNYCSYLEETYLCFFLTRYNHSLKKQIQYNKKCYMIDPAIIRTLGFRVSEDVGRLLENTAFLHLKMQGKEIYFHKDKKECDFLIREENKITQAIQVTTSLSNPKVKDREVSGLLEAMQAHNLTTGLILTENDQTTLTVDNYKIDIIPIWKWLLQSAILDKRRTL